MTPFFSIVVPCCNVEPYVEDCLLSILNQPFQDWECFAIVEASRDQTEKIVREITEKDERFHFYVLPRSGSPSIARNTALDHAHGKYVIFVDGDDFIFENSLGKLAEKITSHPDADTYPCAVYVQDTRTGKEDIWDNYREDAPAELTGLEAIRLCQHRNRPCFMMQLSVFRLAFLNQNKLRFVPRMKHEDVEFLPRAMFHAKRIVPIHELYYCYRIRKSSITTSKYRSGYILLHRSRVLHNLLAFFGDISQNDPPDPIVSAIWRKWIMNAIFFRWFSPRVIHLVPRKRRLCSLRHVFQNPNAFRFFTENASFFQRLKIFFVLLSVRHPTYGAWIADLFFMSFYKIAETRDFIKKSIKVKKKRDSI